MYCEADGVSKVFSRDILKGGNIGVLAGGRGVENIIHYYYCQSEGGEDSSQGGEDFPPPPPLENTLRSSFHQNFEETKGYTYSPGFFFRGQKNCVEKSNPSESKRKEKLNGACFSCIAHVSREL